MHNYLVQMLLFDVIRYGAIAALLAGSWLLRRRWFPHRHTGYVSVSGYVHECSHCGRLPTSAVRAGFYGTNPDSPEARHYDALKAAARISDRSE